MDLRNAVIEQDIMIKATAVFGGIVIYVPEGVIVQTSTVPIFGGATNKAKATNVVNAPTILINSLCMFGGVEIR